MIRYTIRLAATSRISGSITAEEKLYLKEETWPLFEISAHLICETDYI